jgi:hypothetical protein
MKLTDERLEVIRTWLCGESKIDPALKPEELAAMANELRQLRLRTSTRSRSAWASEVERQSDVLAEDQIAVTNQRRI